jgi:hypothetical protein
MLLRKVLKRAGNARWGCIALLLGLPLPVVALFFLLPGCNR